MKMKRLWAMLLAGLILLCSATAEGLTDAPDDDMAPDTTEEISSGEDVIYYTGGVVYRLLPRDDDSNLINLAYTLTDMPYILLDETYAWDVFVSGGTAPYTITALLAYQTLDLDPFEDGWKGLDQFTLQQDAASFSYVFTKTGRYFWQFDVTDSNGQKLRFQTRIYESYTKADETDVTTTVGKANSIVASLITDDMSDYSRALVLHDWLIYNANYDYTYTHRDASGVLLYGTGVCDSYARAYLMLCTAAGLECVYVSGSAGSDPDPANWGSHGWNLVKLGGSWYHVDCTWDDPGTGGYETHEYFCVSDEVMAKDHLWNRAGGLADSTGMIVPDAEGGEYESSEEEPKDHDFTFTTWEEFFTYFDAMVDAGERRWKTVGLYVGDLSPSEMYSAMSQYSGAKTQELANQGLITAAGYGYSGNCFYYKVTWTEPTAYIRINETEAILSVGQSTTLVPAEFDPISDVFTWSSSDSGVATVSHTFDADSDTPFTFTITGVAPGTAVITVTSSDGATDSIAVTVPEPYQPDLALQLTDEDGLTLTWNSIAGATQYKVMRLFEGKASVLLTTETCSAVLKAAQLPADVGQKVYVVAERVIGGKTVLSYTSNAVTYGRYSFDYTAVLPADATSIGDEAFLNNENLTAVYVPDGVSSIGGRAFCGCAQLYVVRLPQSITAIGSGAFDGTGLRYAEVVQGSYADTWLQKYYPDVHLIY